MSVDTAVTGLSEDACLLIAALAENLEVDQVAAPPEVWDEVRSRFPAWTIPEPGEDGVIRIGGEE